MSKFEQNSGKNLMSFIEEKLLRDAPALRENHEDLHNSIDAVLYSLRCRFRSDSVIILDDDLMCNVNDFVSTLSAHETLKAIELLQRVDVAQVVEDVIAGGYLPHIDLVSSAAPSLD